jgi:hypothetical protein
VTHDTGQQTDDTGICVNEFLAMKLPSRQGADRRRRDRRRGDDVGMPQACGQGKLNVMPEQERFSWVQGLRFKYLVLLSI